MTPGATQGTQMRLKDTLRIEGSIDNCSVARNENGTIFVGAITLNPDETDDYLRTLDRAITRLLGKATSS